MPKKYGARTPPSSADFSSIRPHPGQMRIVEAMRSHRVVVHSPGRRWGKSSCRIMVCVDQILRSTGWIEGCCGAQSHAEATNLWEKDLLAYGPLVKDAKNEDQRRFIDLWPLVNPTDPAQNGNRGCRLWYPSLGDDHAQFQGHGLRFAILDEMSLLGVGAWQDTIRPMLADTGGPALVYGTPYPEGKNFADFADLWEAGNPDNHLDCGDPTCQARHRLPGYVSSSGPSWENPYINGAEIRSQYDELVARGQAAKAKCLYLGQFCTDIGAVFTNLDEVFCLKPSYGGEGLWIYRDPREAEGVVVGIDFGRHDDATVCVAFSRFTLEMLGLLRIENTEYLTQLPMIDNFVRKFPKAQIWAEGREEVAAELLRKQYGESCGLVKWSAGGPWDKAGNVAKGMDYCQRAAWKMLDVPWLRDEFTKFERKKSPSGRWVYQAPEGRHDDGVAACLYATWGLPLIPTLGPIRPRAAQPAMSEFVFRPPTAKRAASLTHPFLLPRRG